MNNYPKRFIGEPDGRWPEDLVEDYRKPHSDDERRQMLINWGVDRDHYEDMIHLFGPHGQNDPQWKW